MCLEAFFVSFGGLVFDAADSGVCGREKKLHNFGDQ